MRTSSTFLFGAFGLLSSLQPCVAQDLTAASDFEQRVYVEVIRQVIYNRMTLQEQVLPPVLLEQALMERLQAKQAKFFYLSSERVEDRLERMIEINNLVMDCLVLRAVIEQYRQYNLEITRIPEIRRRLMPVCSWLQLALQRCDLLHPYVDAVIYREYELEAYSLLELYSMVALYPLSARAKLECVYSKALVAKRRQFSYFDSMDISAYIPKGLLSTSRS